MQRTKQFISTLLAIALLVGAVPGQRPVIALSETAEMPVPLGEVTRAVDKPTNNGFILPNGLKIIDNEAFLAAAVESLEIPNGVQEIRNLAFSRCTYLKSVVFPDHDLYIADDAFDGSELVEFYAYSGTNVIDYAHAHGIPVYLLDGHVSIRSITPDRMQANVDETITWTVTAEGEEGLLYYRYVLRKDGEIIYTSNYTTRSSYTYTPSEEGVYVLEVSCFDNIGTTTATAENVVVGAAAATIRAVKVMGTLVMEGSSIVWDFDVLGDRGTHIFSVELFHQGKSIFTRDGLTDNRFTWDHAEAGEYVLNVNCVDGTVLTVAESQPFIVYTQEEINLPAPQLIPTTGYPLMAGSEEQSPVYTASTVPVQWQPVIGATSYGMILCMKVAEDWVPVHENFGMSETKFELPAALFTGVAQPTQYRLNMYSSSILLGKPSEWYFCVEPNVTDESILIHGASTAYWDQVGKQANNRFFEVQSELPWTAAVDVEWIDLSVDKTGVMVKMLDSIYSHDLHVGTVTLNNGINTAKIVVTRDSSSNNVTLDNHNWSKNESSPSQIPAGGTYLEVTHSYEKLALTIYEKQSSGTWSQVYFTFVDDRIALQDTVGGYAFQGDTDYRFTFTGHITEDRWQTAEVTSEIPETHYYVHMTSTGHALTVEEKKNQSMTIIDSLCLSVDATNIWNVSEDADWLTAYINERGYRDVDINAQPNYTGADRTAEVVFTCGNAQVILTLTQPDMTPKLLFPENLSQSQSSPTLITDNNFAYKYIGNTLQFYYLQNGEFVKDEINYIRTSPFGILSDTWLAECFEPNLLYKLEISDDAGNATNYYVKFEAASSAYVTIEDLGLYEWAAPGAASSTTVTLAASGTWKASSDASWLTVSSTSGSKTSGKKLTVSVTENTTGAPRTGTITFTRGTADTAYVKVAQDVASSYLAIYDKEKETITEDAMTTDVLDGDEQTYDIYVYTEDAWELSENASWISTKITDNRLRLTISENGVGGSLRKANITVTTATAKCTLTVQQAPKLAAPVVNWDVSTDYKNPSVLIKEDHTFSWTTVAGATYYNVVFRSVGPDGSTYYGSKIVENGSSSYTYTLPENWQQVYADDYCYLEVEAVDAYGHEEPSEQFSFYITDNPKAFLNGSSAPEWLNAVDVPVSKKFTVSSVGSWTAAARQSWISLDVTSGVSGDVLTVSLADNTGAARSGQVSVVCGGYETILNITQCGMLEEYPSLLTPVLSDDYISPTVMPADTTSLTVTWEQAPQAGFYWAFIETMKPDSGWTTIADSDYMYKGTGTYTFNNLSLTAGQIYRLHFVRSCERHGATGKSYFILADGAESFVLADGENTQLFDAFGDEDVETYRITAGGVWTAEASDDWIMVASHSVDQKELDENGYTSTRYSTYLGRPDTKLVISLLANPNKAVRKGTVTLRSGSASMVINVSQDPYYDAAQLISPALGESSSTRTERKPGALTLKWSSAEGGTGVYCVQLKVYDEEYRGYAEIFERETNACEMTIPADIFEENRRYLLYLYTEVEGLDYDVSESYYFDTTSMNDLIVSAQVDVSSVLTNGKIIVRASAQGGAGGYQYAYELLRDGKSVDITEWATWESYIFMIDSAGSYSVKVYCKDAANDQSSEVYTCCNVRQPEITLTIDAANGKVGDKLLAIAENDVQGDCIYRFNLYRNGVCIKASGEVSSNMNSWYISEPGSYMVEVQASSSASLVTTVKSKEYVFESTTDSCITGVVLDAGAQPIKGVTVRICDDAGTQIATVNTVSTGKWQWDGAQIGQNYTISFAKEGYTFDTVLTVNMQSVWGEIAPTVYAVGSGYQVVKSAGAISGEIATMAGVPTSGVTVLLKDVSGAVIESTMTDEDGRWGFTVADAGTYAIVYSQTVCVITPESSIVQITTGHSVQLSAVAEEITADVSPDIAFTMSAREAEVGDTVTFEITVPETVEKLRLIVDDSPYDVFYASGGTASLQRAFSSDGERRISFQVASNGQWAATSEEQVLYVTSKGKLDAPVFGDIESHYTGEPLTIDWPDVANASAYTVRLYRSGGIIERWMTDESAFTMEGICFAQDADYKITVMATGAGYSQSLYEDVFDVVKRHYDMELTSPWNGAPYVVGNQIDITMTQSGGYLAVQVVAPSGMTTWYPTTETGVTAERDVWFPVPVKEVGQYKITPYLYSVEALPGTCAPMAVGDTVTVKSSGPEIKGIYPEKKNYTWIAYSTNPNIRVVTNTAVDRVEIVENGVVYGSSESYTEDQNSWLRTFDVVLDRPLSNGAHTLTANATDTDVSLSRTDDVTFFVVNYVTTTTVYPQAQDLTIVSSPFKGRDLEIVHGGTSIDPIKKIGYSGDWVMVKTTDDSQTGFVPADMVASTVWSGASGKISITSPSDGMAVSNTANFTISWETGFVEPENCRYFVDIRSPLSGKSVTALCAKDDQYVVTSSSLETDTYAITVHLMNMSTMKVISKSEPITIIFGDFSLDEAYRTWWLKNIAPRYEAYVIKDKDFYGEAKYVWYKDPVIIMGPRPRIIYDAATLAYTQKLQDFEDFVREYGSGAENNSATIVLDEAARRRVGLITIAEAMMDEQAKGNLKLNADLSNADSIAKGNQQVAAEKAALDCAFSTVDALTTAFDVGMKTAGLTSGNPSLGEAVDPFVSGFKGLMDSVKAVIEKEMLEKHKALKLVAYVEQYAYLLSSGCSTYSDYLETTYVDSSNSAYSSYAQEYINAFRSLQNEPNVAGDPSELYDLAFDEMCGKIGVTREQLEQIIARGDKEIDSGIVLNELGRHLASMINMLFQWWAESNNVSAYENVQVVKYNESTGQFEFDVKALTLDSINFVTEKLVTEWFKTTLEWEKFVADIQEIEMTESDVLNLCDKAGTAISTVKDATCVIDIILDSWELGVSIREIIDSSITLSEQSDNKGLFDTYGIRLITEFEMRKDAASKLPNYDWETLSSTVYTIDDLERYRQNLVTITNMDTALMYNYRNMRIINDNNGFKFSYDLNWLTLAEIDEKLETIALYRKIFTSMPKEFELLFK